jgi:hypothetical protein
METAYVVSGRGGGPEIFFPFRLYSPPVTVAIKVPSPIPSVLDDAAEVCASRTKRFVVAQLSVYDYDRLPSESHYLGNTT